MQEVAVRNIEIEALPGQKLQIMRGDTVRVHVAFEYRGPTMSVTPYASIGQIRLGVFDEIASNVGPAISLSQSQDWRAYTGYVDIDSSPVSPGTNYDLMAKLKEYPGETEVRLTDVIDVLGAAEFRNFEITEYVAR